MNLQQNGSSNNGLTSVICLLMQVDGEIDGWMDGWMDGRTDGQITLFKMCQTHIAWKKTNTNLFTN